METNETLKMALLQETETAMSKMMEQLQSQPEGDLNQLEHTVLSTCLEMGQRWLEKVLNHPRQENRPQARREGECGHTQRLVGERPKQLLTLLGKVTVRRPYYQCLRPEATQESASCPHGQAPARCDLGHPSWAKQSRSAEAGELFGSVHDVRGGSSRLSSGLATQDVSPSSPQFAATSWGNLGQTRG